MLLLGCSERKELIEAIRKKGNFEIGNNRGEIIPIRRPGLNAPNRKYEPCPSCYGYYSKVSLRKHYITCTKNYVKGGKNLFHLTRKLTGRCHAKANDIVKNEILPVLRDDSITNLLKYDELVIVYANKMSLKYRKKHYHKMIRAKLRLIGRILIELQKIDETVLDFSSIFSPKHYDNVILAVNRVAGLIISEQKYKAPSTAFAAGTLLKKCGNIYVSELIKKQDLNRQAEVENFLKLLEGDYGISINKTVEENQLQQKRQKKIILPNSEDIKALNDYLKLFRRKYYDLLMKTFSFTYYKKLASLSLILFKFLIVEGPVKLRE